MDLKSAYRDGKDLLLLASFGMAAPMQVAALLFISIIPALLFFVLASAVAFSVLSFISKNRVFYSHRRREIALLSALNIAIAAIVILC